MASLVLSVRGTCAEISIHGRGDLFCSVPSKNNGIGI